MDSVSETGAATGGASTAAGGTAADPTEAAAAAAVAAATTTVGGIAVVDTAGLAATAAQARDAEFASAIADRLSPTDLGAFERALAQEVRGTQSRVGQIMGANRDFVENYRAMREANTINADAYFHCRANFEASQRGPWGEARAADLSDAREALDRLTGDPASASEADQRANAFGREMGRTHPHLSPAEACAGFRPTGLDARY